ncbi:MAG: TrmH family RNA methyltransferase [Flammeovirgaceae bacterium]
MTNRWQKLVRQLQQKKFRKQEGLFLVEGTKSVQELLRSDWEVSAVFYTEKFASETPELEAFDGIAQETDGATLEKSGSLKSNDGAIAVAKAAGNQPIIPAGNFVLALDDVRDPGNLGTLIRVADWYGLQGVVCSLTCADLYNPKTISATKGSFTRMPTYVCELSEYLSKLPAGMPSYGALMFGDNVHLVKFPKQGVIVLGNESNGISPQVKDQLKHHITIPRFGQAESLNVAMAGGIICDNLRRP